MSAKQKLSKEDLVITQENNKQPIVLEYATLRKAVLSLRAINHPLRKKMLLLIEEKAKITVTEIYHQFDIEQSVASQHLAILRRANFVTTQRDGKYIYYEVNKQRFAEVKQLVEELA